MAQHQPFELVLLDQTVPSFGVEDTIFDAGGIDVVDKIILPNVRRLKYLNCLLPYEECSRLFNGIPADVFKMLDIDIDFVNTFGRLASAFAVHMRFSLRPAHSTLRGATLHITNGVRLPGFMVQWSLVTMLDLGMTIIPPEDLMQILQAISFSLIDGFFYVAFNIESALLQYQRHRPIALFSLIKLRLRLVDTSYFPNFLLLFYLPSLRDIWVEWTDKHCPFEWDVPMYARWLSRVSRTLERLLLMDLPFYPAPGIRLHRRSCSRQTSENGLRTLLKAVPKLRTLCLPTGIHVCPPILESIATGEFLPLLEVLELATDDNPNIIFGMLHTRNGAGHLSGRSPIVALNLILPSTRSNAREKLRQKVEALHLAKGYRLQFLSPCNTCSTHCCFGN